MSDEARQWIRYARENLRVAEMCLDSGVLNPSLQNAQQAVEKALKAMSLLAGLPLKRTHSIQELRRDLQGRGIEVGLMDEDCELLDSIYLPSKYPLGSALPDFEPDMALCRRCVKLARELAATAEQRAGTTWST